MKLQDPDVDPPFLLSLLFLPLLLLLFLISLLSPPHPAPPSPLLSSSPPPPAFVTVLSFYFNTEMHCCFSFVNLPFKSETVKYPMWTPFGASQPRSSSHSRAEMLNTHILEARANGNSNAKHQDDLSPLAISCR